MMPAFSRGSSYSSSHLIFISFSAQLADGCLFATLNSRDSPTCLEIYFKTCYILSFYLEALPS